MKSSVGYAPAAAWDSASAGVLGLGTQSVDMTRADAVGQEQQSPCVPGPFHPLGPVCSANML